MKETKNVKANTVYSRIYSAPFI